MRIMKGRAEAEVVPGADGAGERSRGSGVAPALSEVAGSCPMRMARSCEFPRKSGIHWGFRECGVSAGKF